MSVPNEHTFVCSEGISQYKCTVPSEMRETPKRSLGATNAQYNDL
jgi:hypothetical protein